MKKIMVVIPVHNGEGLIERTLDSLLDQTLIKFSIAIIDNCSDDKTMEICEQYMESLSLSSRHMIDYRVYQNEENLGRIGNWNKALSIFRESDAEICKLMFVGDTLEPGCLLEQMFYIDKDIAPIVSCAHNVINEDDTSYIMNHNKNEDDEIMKFFPWQALEKSLKDGNWFAGTTACMMFTREALGNLKFSDTLNWAADWDFWARMMDKNKMVYMSKPLANFYMDARKGYKRMVGTPQAAMEEQIVNSLIQLMVAKY